jgi:hypothetical protein
MYTFSLSRPQSPTWEPVLGRGIGSVGTLSSLIIADHACIYGWIPACFLPPIQYVNIFDLWIWFETINHIMLMKDEKAYKKISWFLDNFFIIALLLKSNLTLITKINKYKSLLWWVSLSIKEGMYLLGTMDNFCRFIPRKVLFVFFLFWSENWGKIITRSKADILEKDTYIKKNSKRRNLKLAQKVFN